MPSSSIEPPALAAPKILHYRGTSFDLLNPHDSLRLSDIQTPPEREQDTTGYFGNIPSLEDLIQEEMARSGREGAAPGAVRFSNLTDAHQFITKGNSGLKVDADEVVEEPPSQAQTPKSSTQPPIHQTSFNSGSGDPRSHTTGRGIPTEIETPTKESPLRKISRRISTYARFGRKHPAPEERQSTSVSMPEISTSPPQIAEQNFGRSSPVDPPVQAHEPTLTILDRPRESIHLPEDFADVAISYLPAAAEYMNPYERESIYADSNTGSNRPPSTVVGTRQSVAYGHQTGQLDYSDATQDISSYRYEYAESSQNARKSNFAHTSHEDADRQRDTTVTNIIRQYGTDYTQSPSLLAAYGEGGDISHQSLGVGVYQEEESTADFSTLAGDEEPKGNVSTSGFSQFDFGLHSNSPPSDGSFAEGPDFSSPESIPAPLNVVAGPAPRGPLPPVPYSKDIEPLYKRRKYAQQYSDLGSNVTSYGETRNLLHLEDDEFFATPRSVMPEVTERSVEDTTFHTDRLLSSLTEPPFGLESAGLSTPIKRHETEPLEPFPSFSSDLEAARYTAGDERANEVSELSGFMQGERLQDWSFSIAPLKVTPKSSERSGLNPAIRTISSSTPANHKKTKCSEVLGCLNDANDVAGNEYASNLTISGNGEYKLPMKPLPSRYAPTAGIHLIWTRSPTPPRRLRRTTRRVDTKMRSTIEMTDASLDDEDDWETVADPSRQNLETGITLTSMGSYSGADSNRDLSARVHPPNSQFNVSQYRPHLQAGSNEPFLVPDYQYGPGSEFLSRNALTPPVFATTQGVSYAPTPHRDVSPIVDPALLSTEPNEEIIYETTPLMFSPMSPPDDSFSKVTELGPKANLTGSPFGTGMRDAGSSVVQSSSPFFHSSPHHTTHKPSPLVQLSDSETPSKAAGPIIPPLPFQTKTNEARVADLETSSPSTWKRKGKAVALDDGHMPEAGNGSQFERTPTLRQRDYVPTATLTEPPKVHVRTPHFADVEYDEHEVVQSSSEPPRLPKPHQGSIRSPKKLRFGPKGYHTLHKPGPSNALDESEDLIELQSLNSKPSFPRPTHLGRLASRANNTISADTLRTQTSQVTGYSALAPSCVESHDTVSPLHPQRPRSHTPRSQQHRRQFSGSNLRQLTLIRPSIADPEAQRQVMLKRHYEVQAKYSWLVVAAVGWIPVIGVCVWSGCFDGTISYFSYGEIGEVGRLQKRVALGIAVAEFFIVGILLAILVPLNLAGTI